ncbi:MAG: hypothetical protein WCR42_16310 [bacterium]
MNMNSNSIEKFQDFATELVVYDKHYDLHNDYVCQSINFDFLFSCLTIIFTSRTNKHLIYIIFNKAEIIKLKFVPEIEEIIVDQIYLGNCMDDNTETIIKGKDKGYFYISFLPDFDIELLAESITILDD